jgi:hypothetical protein
MNWLQEELEYGLMLAKEATPQNSINHPEYIKGTIYGIRFALCALGYAISHNKIIVQTTTDES